MSEEASQLDPGLWDTGWTQDLTFDYLRILSYGTSGMGKNVFAETWPNPTFINMEDGLIGAKVRKYNFPILTPKSWSAMQQLFADPKMVLTTAFPTWDTKTLVFDSVSFLGNQSGLAMRQIMAEKSGSKAAYPTITEFGRVTDKMRGLFTLTRTLKYNVLLICQEYTERNELTGDIGTKPSMIGQMRDEAAHHVDICLWHTIEFNEQAQREYAAYPVRVTRNIGKDRLGVLPDRIVNPTYEGIMTLVRKAMEE